MTTMPDPGESGEVVARDPTAAATDLKPGDLTGQKGDAPVAPSGSARETADRRYLDQLSKFGDETLEALNQELATVAAREKVNFRLWVVAAVLGLVLLPSGLLLVVFKLLAVGIISSAAGLCSAAATAPLRIISRDLADQRYELMRRRDEQNHLLRAIHIVNMVPDEAQRNSLMADLASRLIRTVGSTAEPRNTIDEDVRRRRRGRAAGGNRM
jgi:hypothetical protein